MVKAVVGDETQLKLAENRLTRSAIPSQVGLVIGKLSSNLDKGFVYDLVPTPSNDNGEPPCSLIDGVGVGNSKKKGSSRTKSQPESSTLFVDNEWVSEHARQVSRMLLGGMKVVGIYIWVNESSFKNSAITLCQTVKGVAQAASLVENDWNERLLIHISYSPLRWTCRNCSLAANIASSNLRPCDFKMGKVLSSLQTFRCTYNFDIRLPLGHEDGRHIGRFADVFRHGIMIHAKELRSSKALIDGKLEDIIMSLLSRVEMLCDEADRESESIADGGKDSRNQISIEKPVPQLNLGAQRKQYNISFPRRVFIPWLEGTYICDYIKPSETVEVVKDNCVDLMSMEAPTDASEILEPEYEAPPLITSTTKSFWDIAAHDSSAAKSDNSVSKRNEGSTHRKSAKSSDLNPMVAVLVVVLSIIVGLVFFLIRAA
ncbi:protein odr-4 homolog isoform X2 [Olea europaea var. sylvestris]|uniref:protein odr-4 homolog isoform X2 n=1 Tax=Olea europaea var. sylvestris TaxID=158386 RepID=UPI000C1D02B3|nr:protein odr-4 homolog isoform X2 [Olea europaea var. sylvestris]